jgi:hypothetical protein
MNVEHGQPSRTPNAASTARASLNSLSLPGLTLVLLFAVCTTACTTAKPRENPVVPEPMSDEAPLDPAFGLEALSGPIPADRSYFLVNKTSKLCLSVRGNSGLEAAGITQASCSRPNEAQQWRLLPVGSEAQDAGFYSLSLKHSGQALSTVRSNGLSASAPSASVPAVLVQSPYLARRAQQWRVQPVTGSQADPRYVRLLNRESGLALSLPGCSKNPGDQAGESPLVEDGKCAEFSQEFGLSGVAQVVIPEPLGFKQKDFVIGAYIGPALTTYAPNRFDFLPGDLNEDRRRFADVKAAGFNLLLKSFKLILPKEQTMRELSLAAELNLKYIVADNRVVIPALNNGPADLGVAKAVTDDYKNLPAKLRDAVYGYDLGDEPASAFPSLKDWVGHVKSNDPSKLAYTNLLPRHAFVSDQAYLDYVDSFYPPNPLGSDRSEVPDVISYDYYPLLRTSAYNRYFENMRLFSGRAKALGISFWTYPISVQDNAEYRVIDPRYLRFQAFSPIAYGANGLVYYTYGTFQFCNDVFTATSCDTSSNGSNVRFLGEAMIGIDQTSKTPIYYWAQEINKYLRDVVGPVVMRSSHLGVYHNSDYTYEGYGVREVIPAQERVTSSTPLISSFSDANSNSMVGVFRDNADSSVYHLLVVNRGYQGENLDVTLNLKGNLVGRVLETSMANPDLNPMPAQVFGDTTRVVSRGLAPGEGRLIKVTLP